jgi:hypothetical protein
LSIFSVHEATNLSVAFFIWNDRASPSARLREAEAQRSISRARQRAGVVLQPEQRGPDH